MKCDRTQKVSLLIDGELPQAEARELERHLDLCGDCQSAREDFLLLRRQIADYPLDHDAFARQRALKSILAAGGNTTLADARHAAALDNEAVARAPRRRIGFAGAFAMSRPGAAALAALLLLLFGVVAGLVSLTSSRRAPVEIVTNAPAPAPADNNNNRDDGSSAATSNALPPAPDDPTASASKPGGGELIAGNDQERAGAKAAQVARENAGGRVPKRSSKRPLTPLDPNRPPVDAPFAEEARNDAQTVDDGAGDAGGVDARPQEVNAARAQRAGESKTARHVEQAQLLLRSFRNARAAGAGRRASPDLAYEKQRSRKLLYENIVLRREAASRGNLPVESLLDSLEPILIDIANLPDKPAPAELKMINERMRRQNLVAMLQISAVESASARSY
jgi:hypothetical protein